MSARKLLTITIPSVLVSLLFAAAATEVWVRATWDPKRGTPGLFVSDPVLNQRMAPFYSGLFAGVPVRTNNLGFRDDRDYSVAKTPATVRVLFVGDSVTFGYGSVYEHTYPYLLEQQFRKWRPDVDWQVWNTAVPGYSTSQELAYVEQVAPRFAPDLVVVGFFMNDVEGNYRPVPAGISRRAASAVKNEVKRRLYSYDLYRKARYGIEGKLFATPTSRVYLDALGQEAAMLAVPDVTRSKEQQITYPSQTPPQPTSCDGRSGQVDAVKTAMSDPSYAEWLAAVRGFQQLHQSGKYRVLFFVNIAPDECRADDRYYDGSMRPLNEFFIRTLSANDTLVVSSYDAFRKYRPSQMPLANWHSVGNANRVKASVLFNFLSGYLPHEVPQLRSGAIAR